MCGRWECIDELNILCSFTRSTYDYGNNIQQDEMGKAYNTHTTDQKFYIQIVMDVVQAIGYEYVHAM